MRLYSENSSPFSAPVRVALYAKTLDIEIVAPPGGLRSAQYHAINPLGTIPCLIFDDGTRLPESSAIMEYLEEKFPTPALLPKNPEARAQVRLLQRIGELHIMTNTVELSQAAPNSEESANRLTRLVRGLSALQGLLRGESFAAGATPENSYSMSPDDFQLNFVSTREESDFTHLFLRSSGADSPRGIWMQQYDGLWYTVNNASTYAQVREPKAAIDARRNAHDADFDLPKEPEPVEVKTGGNDSSGSSGERQLEDDTSGQLPENNTVEVDESTIW